MNNILILIIILVPTLVFLFFMFRANQRQMQRLADPKAMDAAAMWLQNVVPVEAVIEGKEEVIKPEAKGLAKVDLQLRIPVPDSEPILEKTTWLVEIESLPELVVGNTVKVKLNLKKHDRIFPDVPWARLWMFEG